MSELAADDRVASSDGGSCGHRDGRDTRRLATRRDAAGQPGTGRLGERDGTRWDGWRRDGTRWDGGGRGGGGGASVQPVLHEHDRVVARQVPGHARTADRGDDPVRAGPARRQRGHRPAAHGRHRRRLPESHPGQVPPRRPHHPAALGRRRAPPGHHAGRKRPCRRWWSGTPGPPPKTRDMLAAVHGEDQRRLLDAMRAITDTGRLPAAARVRAAGRPGRATWAGLSSGTGRCTRRSTTWTRRSRRSWPGLSPITSTQQGPRPRERPGSPRGGRRWPAACSACARTTGRPSCGMLLVEPWARGLGIGARR